MNRSESETPSEKWAVILLRIGGVIMLLAFGAVFMPSEWMAASHRRLGLGEFPVSPLVDYLARSASVLYGVHGGLYLVIARDVRRYDGVLVYLAWVAIGFGVLMVGIDLHAGMPLYWTLGEGPPISAFGALLLALRRGIPRA